jgi:phosphoribosylaminoimidazole (AIR) synthetase
MSTEELYRTLNMGIGMVVICGPDDLATLQDAIAEPTWVIGELAPGTGRVHLT